MFYAFCWFGRLNLGAFRFCKPSEEKRQKQVSFILEKLISLTIEEVEMYPSIQAKIWGSIGQVPELIDMVLDNFIHRSVQLGLGSPMVEIMADTSVALASANVQLVAKKVIGRLCRVSNVNFFLVCFVGHGKGSFRARKPYTGFKLTLQFGFKGNRGLC